MPTINSYTEAVETLAGAIYGEALNKMTTIEKEAMPWAQTEKLWQDCWGEAERRIYAATKEIEMPDFKMPEPPLQLPKEIMTAAEIQVAKRKIRAILKENTRGKFIPNRKSGKINPRKLWRAALNSPRLFQKKQANKYKDYAMQILVDTSGSMNEGYDGLIKCEVATRAIQDLVRMLVDLKEVSLSVDTFNKRTLSVYKKGDKLKGLAKSCADKIDREAKGRGYGGCNCDGFFVEKFSKELAKNKAQTKILAVLSDGQPANCHGHAAEHNCKLGESDRELLAAARKAEKHLRVGSLGILTNAPSRYYKNHATIDKPEQLFTSFLSLLRRLIK